MITCEQPITVHSVGEAHLYLMLVRCEQCGRGPFRAVGEAERLDARTYRLSARCGHCRHPQHFEFVLSTSAAPGQRADRINATPQPSRAIDVFGWVVLFRTILAEADRTPNRQETRQLGYEAAQCLDEALKFFDGESEQPGPEAFFSDESRRRFEEHPEQLLRSRLIDLRNKLPGLDRMTASLGTAAAAPRRWWQFWRR